jgi:hypothetical protein
MAKALWEMMVASRWTDWIAVGETHRTRHAGVSCLFGHLQAPSQMAIRSQVHCECNQHNLVGFRRISFGAFCLLIHTQYPISQQELLKSAKLPLTSQTASPRPQFRCGLKHGMRALRWLKRQMRYAGKFTVHSAIVLTRRPAFRDRHRE